MLWKEIGSSTAWRNITLQLFTVFVFEDIREYPPSDRDGGAVDDINVKWLVSMLYDSNESMSYPNLSSPMLRCAMMMAV